MMTTKSTETLVEAWQFEGLEEMCLCLDSLLHYANAMYAIYAEGLIKKQPLLVQPIIRIQREVVQRGLFLSINELIESVLKKNIKLVMGKSDLAEQAKLFLEHLASFRQFLTDADLERHLKHKFPQAFRKRVQFYAGKKVVHKWLGPKNNHNKEKRNGKKQRARAD